MKQHVVNVRLSKVLYDQIKSLAATREESIAESIRRLLEQGASTEIVAQGLDTITAVIRKTIRAELKSTENRLAALGAKASIAAGTSEHMLTTLFERSISGEASEKRRQAKAIHDEARRSAVSGLKQPGGDENA
jgi:predicted DNA-binding ribbon-helix-helix protein